MKKIHSWFEHTVVLYVFHLRHDKNILPKAIDDKRYLSITINTFIERQHCLVLTIFWLWDACHYVRFFCHWRPLFSAETSFALERRQMKRRGGYKWGTGESEIMRSTGTTPLFFPFNIRLFAPFLWRSLCGEECINGDFSRKWRRSFCHTVHVQAPTCRRGHSVVWRYRNNVSFKFSFFFQLSSIHLNKFHS